MSPNSPKTQHRSVRIGDDDWAELADAAASQGLDRAKVINHLIEWYLRRPGAKLPKRPDPGHGRPSSGSSPNADNS